MVVYGFKRYGALTKFRFIFCYCTTELQSSLGRPSVVRKTRFLRTQCNQAEINAKFGRKVPFHNISQYITIYHIRPFVLFLKIVYLWFFFFRFCFVAVNIEPYGRKKLQTTSPLKVHNRFTPIFQILDFCHFFFFFVFIIMGSSYGRNKLQPTCVKVHNRFAPKHSCIITPRKGLYQSCIKNCEISNFGFGANFFVLFCKRLVVKWNGSTFRRPLV